MVIIYIVLVFLSLVLAGVNIEVFFFLSYDLGNVIRGRLKLKTFIKRTVLGLLICLVCNFVSVILTGEIGFRFSLLFWLGLPVFLIVGLISNLIIGQQFKPSMLYDIITEVISRQERNRL